MENQKNFCLTKIIRAKLANGKILTFISQRIFFKKIMKYQIKYII